MTSARGALLGLAVGDALGAPLESHPREVAQAAVANGLELTGGLGWEPGEWTDDTAMALCLAESIGARGVPLDLDDLAGRYSAWAASGPKDIGNITRTALRGAGSAAEARANSRAAHERHGMTAGNGTVMRVTPLAFAAASREEILAAARIEARLTHWDPAAGESSAALCAAFAALADGEDPVAAALAECVAEQRVSAAVELAAEGALDEVGRLAEGAEGGTCWATLACGLVALQLDDYESGVTWAISHGHDTDTNAAVAGGLLGARDGVGGIPSRWLEGIRERERIEAAADRLAAGASETDRS